jgi:hypothetical protein
MKALPLRPVQSAGLLPGINAGDVQHFAGVQITDARNTGLVEQDDFDRRPTVADSRGEIVERDFAGVGPDLSRHQFFLVVVGGQHCDDAKATLVPEQNVRIIATTQRDPQSQMFGRGWRADQDQSGHSRFDYDSVVGFQANNDTFSQSVDRGNSLTGGATIQPVDAGVDRNWASRGRCSLNGNNFGTGHMGNSAPHGFDFREFRHGYLDFNVARWSSTVVLVVECME